MTCPNDTDHDGDCHLCHRLSTGCFLRDTTPAMQTQLLAALLQPTIEMMFRADILRMTCGTDKSFVIQFGNGDVVTLPPPPANSHD
jgi:hypothetical protein